MQSGTAAISSVRACLLFTPFAVRQPFLCCCGLYVVQCVCCALTVANGPSLASPSPLQRGPIRQRRVQP